MKVQVANFRLYASDDTDESCEALLLREVDGHLLLFAYYRGCWYQLSASKAGHMYGIGLLRSNTGLRNAMAFTFDEEMITLLHDDETTVEYRQTRNHLIEITAVPLPPEVREVLFHGVSQDSTQRLVVVRSKYYADDTRFYRAYLGSSYIGELPRLDFASDEPIRNTEEGESRYVFLMASGKKLAVSPGGRVDSSYGNVDFMQTPSRLDFEEGISLLRVKLRIA